MSDQLQELRSEWPRAVFLGRAWRDRGPQQKDRQGPPTLWHDNKCHQSRGTGLSADSLNSVSEIILIPLIFTCENKAFALAREWWGWASGPSSLQAHASTLVPTASQNRMGGSEGGRSL